MSHEGGGAGEVHYRLLVGKSELKNHLGNIAVEGRNIQTVLHEVGWWRGLN